MKTKQLFDIMAQRSQSNLPKKNKMRKIKPKEYKAMTDTPVATPSSPEYPRFRIELAHLPEAKKWEIGKEYEVCMKIKMTGISISKYQNDAEFDITGLEPDGE